MTPEQEQKLNDTHDLLKDLRGAILGDEFGNKGYKHRLAAVEAHVETAKEKRQRERGFTAGIALLWGGVVWLMSKIFHI